VLSHVPRRESVEGDTKRGPRDNSLYLFVLAIILFFLYLFVSIFSLIADVGSMSSAFLVVAGVLFLLTLLILENLY
jgi:hypothetical protein